MNKTTVLIFGKNQYRNAVLVEQLNEQFQPVTVTTDEQAIEKFQQSAFDAVIFSEGVAAGEKIKLQKIFSLQDDNTVFTEDNGTDQATTTISDAITAKRKENKPSFSFTDDALKNAGLNINIQ